MDLLEWEGRIRGAKRPRRLINWYLIPAIVGHSRLPTRSWGGLFSLSCLNANTKECVWRPAFSRRLRLGSRPDQVSEDEGREAQETSLESWRSKTESLLVWFLDQQHVPTWFLLVLICAITLFPPPLGVKSSPPQRAHESPKCSQGFSACFYLIHPSTPQIPTEHPTMCGYYSRHCKYSSEWNTENLFCSGLYILDRERVNKEINEYILICPQYGRPGFDPWVKKILWRRAWQPTSVFWPGESPWTKELGRLQSMGLQRVRHAWVTYRPCIYMYMTPGRTGAGHLGKVLFPSSSQEALLLFNLPDTLHQRRTGVSGFSEHRFVHLTGNQFCWTKEFIWCSQVLF